MISLKEFDYFWDNLPRSSDYYKYSDFKYWEFRVAIVCGGVVFTRDERMVFGSRDRIPDVLVGGVVVEVKTSILKNIVPGRKGFMFSHLDHAFADLVVFIGLCDCKDKFHFWICDYNQIKVSVPKSGFVHRVCPHSGFGNRMFKNTIFSINESDLKAWVEKWETDKLRGL